MAQERKPGCVSSGWESGEGVLFGFHPGGDKSKPPTHQSRRLEREVEEPEFQHKPQLDSRCCHKLGGGVAN